MPDRPSPEVLADGRILAFRRSILEMAGAAPVSVASLEVITSCRGRARRVTPTFALWRLGVPGPNTVHLHLASHYHGRN
jgi:hypothetical protein